MGLNLNLQAYELFVKIEVSLREFLIELIKYNSVSEWTNSFLGRIHVESIKDVGKRIFDANESQKEPNIEDIYVSKISKALKNQDTRYKNLLHPFYYINWADFVGIIGKAANTNLIESAIGKRNRELLIFNLSSLNSLRNDIAHSRYITTSDLIFIKAAYDQICTAIPNFESYFFSQYQEENMDILLQRLLKQVNEIENLSMISMNEIEEIEILSSHVSQSFWINLFFVKVPPLTIELNEQLLLYKEYRNKPGGLLSINKWKLKNKELINKLNTELNG